MLFSSFSWMRKTASSFSWTCFFPFFFPAPTIRKRSASSLLIPLEEQASSLLIPLEEQASPLFGILLPFWDSTNRTKDKTWDFLYSVFSSLIWCIWIYVRQGKHEMELIEVRCKVSQLIDALLLLEEIFGWCTVMQRKVSQAQGSERFRENGYL